MSTTPINYIDAFRVTIYGLKKGIQTGCAIAQSKLHVRKPGHSYCMYRLQKKRNLTLGGR